MKNIYSVEVIVNERDKALEFYRDVLGWQVRDDQAMGPDFRFLTVEIPGDTAAIQLGLPGDNAGEQPRRTVGGQTGISLVSDDLDSEYETLSARGVRFHGKPEDMPWGGKGVTFEDPDGNVFFLAG